MAIVAGRTIKGTRSRNELILLGLQIRTKYLATTISASGKGHDQGCQATENGTHTAPCQNAFQCKAPIICCLLEQASRLMLYDRISDSVLAHTCCAPGKKSESTKVFVIITHLQNKLYRRSQARVPAVSELHAQTRLALLRRCLHPQVAEFPDSTTQCAAATVLLVKVGCLASGAGMEFNKAAENDSTEIVPGVSGVQTPQASDTCKPVVTVSCEQ